MTNQKYILERRTPKPASLLEWAEWYETADRRIASTLLAPTVRVSTVFLGIDHNFAGDGPPLLFETMVFGGPMNGHQRRYSTYELAELGHNAVCAEVAQVMGINEGGLK